ncbi:MAG: ATP-binding cassette domain-containing protein, partial [bacterium]
MRKIRGNEISMIFQEPMTSLNPVLTIGTQVMEPILLHERAEPSDARRRALALLARVRFPDPARAFAAYPHQLSGGMRQRAMIAMALACRPKLLIADEPTTALDTTIQAEILDLLEHLKRELQLAVLLITHNLGIVSATAARVGVMQGGRIVEDGAARRVLRAPRHPYTVRLLDALPSLAKRKRERRGGAARTAEPLLAARDLAVHFPVTSGILQRVTGHVKAVDGASLVVRRGAVTALVGESGCGKTTLGKALLGLVPITGGGASLGLTDVGAARGRALMELRRRMQIVFQDPYGSLNPRLAAGDIVTE